MGLDSYEWNPEIIALESVVRKMDYVYPSLCLMTVWKTPICFEVFLGRVMNQSYHVQLTFHDYKSYTRIQDTILAGDIREV